MDYDKAVDLEKKYYARVFNRLPVCITRGEGVYCWDSAGKKYLDFFAGIAVKATGHCHPKIVSAITKQAETLIHTSNWLYTEPQIKLAEKLNKLTGQEKVFFTNDGTEAVECAIKLARRATGKSDFIAFGGSFHGRTLGALSATSGDRYRRPFEPLVPGFSFVEYNNLSAVEDALTGDTAAVIVEPIQGESGIIVPDEGYLKGLRDLTEDKDVLLIVDEVQTGFGRTGKMFAYEHEGIKPDILCVAKALGSGFPIGACLYSGIDFEPGEHGGTFLGGPLACAAADASLEVIEEEDLVDNSKKMGDVLGKGLSGLGASPRGLGLMQGVDVVDGRETVLKLIERGVLTIFTDNTVRLLPPLIISESHVGEFLEAFGEVV